MIYTVYDLFPDCCIPNCNLPYAGGYHDNLHSHVLPHQLEIMTWGSHPTARSFLSCQGGVGSAKTVAFAARTVDEMLSVPCHEGVVFRKDYRSLFRSSWRAVKECIAKLVRLEKIEPPHYTNKRQGDYTLIEFQNKSLLYGAHSGNLSEALGSSCGLFWGDDAMELSEELFIGDETSGGIFSRLRTLHVSVFKDSTGTVVNRLIGMVSSNPPPIGHWLHKLFGKEPGIYQLDPDDVNAGVVKVMQVSTEDNPFASVGYSKSITAIQKRMGKDPKNIERLISGKSLPAYGGTPVFPEFDNLRHVGKFPCDSDLPLIVSIDFGYLHPGITFSNLYKCEYSNTHFITLSEISDLTSSSIWQVYAGSANHLGIKGHIAKRYHESKLIYFCGDKDGHKTTPTSKDRRSQIKILRIEYQVTVKTLELDLNPSLEYCRGLLERDCPCGLAYILIDNQCEVLIGGLEGGYKYTKRRGDGVINDKPFEDKFYADLCCSWRYGLENYVRHGITDSYIENIPRTQTPQPSSWDWMNAVDELVAQSKMLTK